MAQQNNKNYQFYETQDFDSNENQVDTGELNDNLAMKWTVSAKVDFISRCTLARRKFTSGIPRLLMVQRSDHCSSSGIDRKDYIIRLATGNLFHDRYHAKQNLLRRDTLETQLNTLHVLSRNALKDNFLK